MGVSPRGGPLADLRHFSFMGLLGRGFVGYPSDGVRHSCVACRGGGQPPLGKVALHRGPTVHCTAMQPTIRPLRRRYHFRGAGHVHCKQSNPFSETPKGGQAPSRSPWESWEAIAFNLKTSIINIIFETRACSSVD